MFLIFEQKFKCVMTKTWNFRYLYICWESIYRNSVLIRILIKIFIFQVQTFLQRNYVIFSNSYIFNLRSYEIY